MVKATDDPIIITLTMPPHEADAFAQLLKRLSYTDCVSRSNR